MWDSSGAEERATGPAKRPAWCQRSPPYPAATQWHCWAPPCLSGGSRQGERSVVGGSGLKPLVHASAAEGLSLVSFVSPVASRSCLAGRAAIWWQLGWTGNLPALCRWAPRKAEGLGWGGWGCWARSCYFNLAASIEWSPNHLGASSVEMR